MNAGPGCEDIHCVSFDAAGTLLHPYPSVGDVYREIALVHGCDCSAAALNRGFHAAFEIVAKDANIADPEERERDFWRQVVHQTFASARAPAVDLERLFTDLWAAFAQGNRWRVNSDAVATLKTLRTRGYQLAVLSNWDRRLHSVLRDSALSPLFDAVIISTEAGSEKPQPGIFRAAERVLGANSTACMHIGDSPRHDLSGARAAGWSARLLRHDDRAPTCDEIGRLAQLTDLLPGPGAAVRRAR